MIFGFDSNALQDFYYRGFLDQLIENHHDIYIYPPNLFELLEGANNNIKRCFELFKYFLDNNIKLECCDYLTFLKVRLGLEPETKAINQIKNLNKIINICSNEEYNKNPVRIGLEEYLKAKYTNSALLLYWWKNPEQLVKDIKRIQNIEVITVNDSQKQRYKDISNKYDLMTISEIKHEISMVKTIKRSKEHKTSIEYLRSIYNDDSKCAVILVQLAYSQLYWDLVLNICENKIEQYHIDNLIDNYFAFIPLTMSIRLIIENILEIGRKTAKELGIGTLADSEFLSYASLTNVDHFVTSDYALYSSGNWVYKHIFGINKPTIKYYDPNKEKLPDWLSSIVK